MLSFSFVCILSFLFFLIHNVLFHDVYTFSSADMICMCICGNDTCRSIILVVCVCPIEAVHCYILYSTVNMSNQYLNKSPAWAHIRTPLCHTHAMIHEHWFKCHRFACLCSCVMCIIHILVLYSWYSLNIWCVSKLWEERRKNLLTPSMGVKCNSTAQRST